MTAETTKKPRGTDPEPPTDEALGAVRKVLVAFFTAWKSFTLFPEDNDICRTALTNLEEAFSVFLATYRTLRLDIEENRFSYSGRIVHQGIQDTEDLAFILFREGMRWLELKEGVTLAEITTCFRMLQDCRATDEDLVGELALSLVDADLSHIEFETIAPVGEAAPLLDLSEFDPHPYDVSDHDVSGGGESPAFQRAAGVSPISLDNVDPDRWKLTTEEKQALKIMVLEAESRDDADEFVDALLMVLLEQNDDEGFLTVAAPLADEFLRALMAARFDLAERIVRTFLRLQKDVDGALGWARPHVEAFLADVSAPETLKCVPDIWPDVPEDVEKLVRLLLLLPADAILALAPLLGQFSSVQRKARLMDVMVALAKKNLGPLRALMGRCDESLARELVLVLGGMQGKEVRAILVDMLEHRSPEVRTAVLRALMARQRDVLEHVFPLIDDYDGNVTALVYEYLGARQNPQTEARLLGYLDGRPFHRAARLHALSCYRALGLCGGSASVPYLRQTVLEETFLPDISRSLHRQGAALALNLLSEPGAKEALQEAAESRFSTVRLACRKAGEYEAELEGRRS